MVEDDTYCIDVLTQVSAATKALQAVALRCSTTTWRTASRRRAPRAVPVADAKITRSAAAIARLVQS